VSPEPAALSETAFTFCFLLVLLVPLAPAGIALINTGLGRSRSAAHSMLASLCVVAVAALAYLVCGFAVQGYPGRLAYMMNVGGRPWSWIAAEPLFLRGLLLDVAPVPLAAFLQLLSVGLAALIPLGSGSDRWRLSAACLSTVVFAGLTYPLFAHWVWGGGWLAQLGVHYGLGRGFLDAGGAGPIHVVGGLTALSIAWSLGPRRGKYGSDGMPSAIPGHNAVLVLFACLLSLLGWLGLNAAGAILFANVGPERLVLIGVNTTVGACAAALAAAGLTRSRFGRPDASLCANGWVGGLVAGSASCAWTPPVGAVLIGAVAGGLVTLGVEWLELRLSIDDPGGSVSVHALAGLWGLLAVGPFAPYPNQWVAQLVGIATLLGFVLPLTYGLNLLLDRVHRYRVEPEGERQGMDLYELGAGAYPEFLTHTDDFLR
jgi:Amt family ammonium transporter